MDTSRISLAHVLALGVPLTWHDAVAVAQEAAMASEVDAAMNSRPPLVTAATCFLTRTGTIELPETSDADAPDAIRHLLRDLLTDDDAPPPLKALVSGRPPRDIQEALERFPVHNRRAVIATLAARALDAQSQRDRTPMSVAHTPPPSPPTPRPSVADPVRPPRVEWPAIERPPTELAHLSDHVSPEFQRLRSKTASIPTPLPRTGLAGLSRRNAWAIGGALAAGTLAALAWSTAGARLGADTPTVLDSSASRRMWSLWTFQPSVRPFPAARDAASVPIGRGPLVDQPAIAVLDDGAMAPAGETAAFLSRGGAPSGSGSAPSAIGADSAPPRPLAVATSELTRPAAVTTPPSAPGDAGRTPAAAPVAPASTRPVTAPAARAMPRGDARRVSLFTAADTDVEPPALRRQQLPTAILEPGTAVPEGWPYLVLVVDESGAVENVRLNARRPAPGQTIYRHAMLVAAAKAWQFDPALKDGRPVRYAIRVPLEP